jgi:hypothetical protein
VGGAGLRGLGEPQRGRACDAGSVPGEVPSKKVVESIHTRDGAYCVDVVSDGDLYRLQTCRRDEQSWQVIDRPGDYASRDEATVRAQTIVAALE